MQRKAYIAVIAAIIAFGAWEIYSQEADKGRDFTWWLDRAQKAQQERAEEAGKEVPDEMWCHTSVTCAKYMAETYEGKLPMDNGGTVLVAVRAEGNRFTYEMRTKYTREEFTGVFEDGTTLANYEADLRANACGELTHKDFVRMGGEVVHLTLYPDGTEQSRIVIDDCPRFE